MATCSVVEEGKLQEAAGKGAGEDPQREGGPPQKEPDLLQKEAGLPDKEAGLPRAVGWALYRVSCQHPCLVKERALPPLM